MNISNRLAKLESVRDISPPCDHPPKYGQRFIMHDGTVNEYCSHCGFYGPKGKQRRVWWSLDNVPKETLLELSGLFKTDPEQANAYRDRLIEEGVIRHEPIK